MASGRGGLPAQPRRWRGRLPLQDGTGPLEGRLAPGLEAGSGLGLEACLRAGAGSAQVRAGPPAGVGAGAATGVSTLAGVRRDRQQPRRARNAGRRAGRPAACRSGAVARSMKLIKLIWVDKNGGE